MHSVWKLTRLALALVTCSLLVPAPAAQANVRQSTPGTSCQFSENYVRRGSTADHPSFTSEYDLWGIWHGLEFDHFGGDVQDVSCTIPRSLPLSTAGLSDLEIRFSNRNPEIVAGHAYCSAYSIRSDGSIQLEVEKDMIIPANPETKTHGALVTLDFGGAINASSSKGYYFLHCALSHHVSLASIYSSEIETP
jgi:hypothetical protein